MARKIEYIIPDEFDGKKVLHYLRGEAKLSAKLVRTLKHYADGITLNGEHIRTVDPVHKGDVLAVNIPHFDGDIEPVPMDIDIVYEDDDIVIINKTPFLAMHPSHNHQGDTLANALVYHLQQKGKPTVFRAVGRLDKGTSGLVVCALNSYSADRISDFTQKEYLAIVKGKTDGGTIDAPIIRPDPMKTTRAVGVGGAEAVTHYEKIKGDGKMTLVRVTPETGRTHQIRVHFAHIGMPIVGDSLYGEDERGLGHQLLHRSKLVLRHPVTKEVMTFTAPMPPDMQSVADEIDNS
ncbi:MAG: RluA family pseudouridine synthase [Clostridia bacterium]|nr:RluA family pseudouridine synthase [Clostridia bacterium]